MNKKDLVLAKKAIAARQIKNEHKVIKETLELQRSERMGGSRSMPNLNSSYSMERSPSTPSLPSINESNSFGNYSPSRTDTLLRSPNGGTGGDGRTSGRGSRRGGRNRTPDNAFVESFGDPGLSQEGNNMVAELSQRATTAKTGLRKMQTQVLKSIKDRDLRKRATTAASERSRSSTAGSGNQQGLGGTTASNAEDVFAVSSGINLNSDNMFMPKKDILRSDGASLSDIYASKRADAWGMILKAQLKQEEDRKKREKKEREEANERYGTLLKSQIQDLHQRAVDATNENNEFAALEDATAKRTEDLQKQRVQDAINRHKQFISNALEDIAVKKKQREKFFFEDLTASTLMVDKAKEAIAKAEAEKEAMKQYHKDYQTQVYHDNMARLERLEKLKQDSWAEDRRIIAEQERQYLHNEARKKQEADARLNRSTEGPAHHIVNKIVEAKRRQDHEFYQTRFKAENMLNTQLKATEDAAIYRNLKNGEGLTEEWEKNARFKAQKRIADEERNNQILATMRKMLSDQEAEDREKRRQKVAAGQRYQHELDAQLQELRARSFNALSKTMSEQEQLYNADMLRTVGVELK